MDAQNDDGIFEQIKSVLHSGCWLGQAPWIYRVGTWLQPVTGNLLGVNARHGKIREYTLQAVQSKKDRGGDRHDILSKLFEIHKDKPTEMELTDVISMAASNINAGSDTTAISLRAVIYHLLQNDHCRAKLLLEIDSVMSADDPLAVVTLEQSKKMPYLQACMYEALRLHPAVGMSLPRSTPAGGISIGSYFIPEKVRGFHCFPTDLSIAGKSTKRIQTIIGANPWAVHYSKEVFGEDADQFRPERWLEDETGDLRMSIQHFARPSRPPMVLTTRYLDRFFFAFGSGARMCLGRSMIPRCLQNPAPVNKRTNID